MPRNILTCASRKRLERKKRLTPFGKYSRVINQFKPEHRATFCQWAKKYQDLLGLTEDDDPSRLTRIEFKYSSHARHGRGKFSKSEVYFALAELLKAVGGSEGLKFNKMVFYRYITSPDHSNLCINYKSLKRQLSYILRE